MAITRSKRVASKAKTRSGPIPRPTKRSRLIGQGRATRTRRKPVQTPSRFGPKTAHGRRRMAAKRLELARRRARRK